MERLELKRMFSDLIESLPSIALKYQQQNAEWIDSEKLLSDEDRSSINDIANIHGLIVDDGNLPMTLFLEDLYVPEIISILNSESPDYNAIANSMKVIEKYAANKNFRLRNFIAASFCGELLGSHQEELKKLFPFFGDETKKLFRMQADIFILSSETLNLLN